jgi:hypothetical protein
MIVNIPIPEFNSDTVVTVIATLAASWGAHKASVAKILKETGEALTSASDYIANSNPETLKKALNDAGDVFQLVGSLQAASKYNGVSKQPNTQ